MSIFNSFSLDLNLYVWSFIYGKSIYWRHCKKTRYITQDFQSQKRIWNHKYLLNILHDSKKSWWILLSLETFKNVDWAHTIPAFTNFLIWISFLFIFFVKWVGITAKSQIIWDQTLAVHHFSTGGSRSQEQHTSISLHL